MEPRTQWRGFRLGEYLRFPELFDESRKIVVAPIDDALIFGPKNGLEDSNTAFREMVQGGADAVLGFPGVFERNPACAAITRRIINVTGSTVCSHHTRKKIIVSIDRALTLDASAMAVHINLTSRYEAEMLEIAGIVISRARRYEMPVFGIVYPRGEDSEGRDDNYIELKKDALDQYTSLVCHCVSLGAEMGFSAIKTQFTGTAASFEKVVSSAYGIPVLIAGGPKIGSVEILNAARAAMKAGAKGVSFGRNVFGRKDIPQFLRQLKETITDADDASHLNA